MVNYKRSKSYKEFLDSKGYSANTKRVYLCYQKHLSELPKKEEIEQFKINHPNNRVAWFFLKSYIYDYLHLRIKIDRPLIKRGKLLVAERSFSEEEYNSYIKALPIRERLICRIMKEGGLRVSEVIGSKENPERFIKPSMIDFRTGKVMGIGKGEREYIAILSEETLEELKEWIKTYSINDDEQIFKIGYCRVRQIMIKVGLELFGKVVTSHWMKRTCGRWMEEQGYSLEERNYYLKHARLDTTLKHYSIKRGVDAVDKIRKAYAKKGIDSIIKVKKDLG